MKIRHDSGYVWGEDLTEGETPTHGFRVMLVRKKQPR